MTHKAEMMQIAYTEQRNTKKTLLTNYTLTYIIVFYIEMFSK